MNIGVRLGIWPALLAAALLFLSCEKPPPPDLHQGYVEAEYTYVSSPLGGRLLKLAIEKGRQVSAGDNVFVLESDLEQAAVREASKNLARAQDQLANLKKGKRPSEIKEIEALLSQARSDLKLKRLDYTRRLKLYKQRAIPQAELDRTRTAFQAAQAMVEQYRARLETARLGARRDEIAAAQAQVDALKARLAQAQWNLGQKQQTAPVSGLVFDTFYTEGEWVPAGRPVAALLTPGNLKIRFFVPEPLLAKLRLGQKTAITCQGCPDGLQARITYISPQVEYTPPVIYSIQTQAKLIFMVEAKLPLKKAYALHPGQPVEVRIMGTGHEKE